MSSKITQYEKDAKALPDSAIYEQTVNERFFQIFIEKSKKCEKMKILKKFAIIIVTICITLNLVMLSASAAKNAVLHFSKSTVNVGDKVTVSVTMNPGTPMYAVGFYLEYNSDVLKYTGGAGTGDAGVLKVIESPSGDKSVKYSFSRFSLPSIHIFSPYNFSFSFGIELYRFNIRCHFELWTL